MIVRHTLIYAGVKFFPALASVIALMVFTRLMSPGQFGEYSLTVNIASTAVAVLANFLIIGLGRFEPAVKTSEERVNLHSTIIITAFIVNLFLILLVAILSLTSFLPNLSVDYFFVVVIFFLTTYLTLSQTLMNANLKPMKYGASLALKNILLLLLGSIGLLLGYGVTAVLASLAFASLIAAIPAVSLWEKITLKRYDFNILKQIWSYGAPLTLLYVFVMIISFSDRIFIDIMLGDSDVGLYSASYDLTQYTLGVIATIIHLAAFPIILKTYEREGDKKARMLLSTTIRMLLFLMIPITIGFISIKEEFAAIFLGEAFFSSSIVLVPILAFSILFLSIKSYYFDYTFQLTKTTWLQTIPPLIAAIINCILNYIFILQLGIVGAAYATLISYIAYLAFTVYLSGKVFKLPPFPWALTVKLILSAMLMWYIISFLKFNFNTPILLIIKVLVGIGVFGGCVFLFIRKDLKSLISDANKFKESI